MTRIYLLIIAGTVINHSSGFFKIALGESAEDVARKHALAKLAAQHNWYFSQYDNRASDFLLKISLSLDVLPDELGIVHVSGRKFMAAYKKFTKPQQAQQQTDNKQASGKRKASRQTAGLPRRVIQHAECVTRTKPKFVLTEFINYLQQF